LQGTQVVNTQGENLGRLEELMLNLNNGRVDYAVVSFGGILGIGDKLFAVPWQALQVDQSNEQIIMNVTREKLEKAPGFDKDNWPQSYKHDWLVEVHDYYGFPYGS
jgi:sporulation protein YlmC with PRC-barrel domain